MRTRKFGKRRPKWYKPRKGALGLDTKKMVKVDSKTYIYIDKDADVEKAKQDYHDIVENQRNYGGKNQRPQHDIKNT